MATTGFSCLDCRLIFTSPHHPSVWGKMHWAHCLLAPLLLVTAVTATRSFGHNGPWDPRLRIPGHKRPSYEMPHIADPDLPADGFEMHDGITRKHWYAIRAGYAAERTFEVSRHTLLWSSPQ